MEVARAAHLEIVLVPTISNRTAPDDEAFSLAIVDAEYLVALVCDDAPSHLLSPVLEIISIPKRIFAGRPSSCLCSSDVIRTAHSPVGTNPLLEYPNLLRKVSHLDDIACKN